MTEEKLKAVSGPVTLISVYIKELKGTEALGKRRMDEEDNRNLKKSRTVISIEGPLQLQSPSLMLPITEREIFVEVYNGILGGKSYIVHGPYQSGKTSFLLALETTLRKEPGSIIIYFDMLDISRDLIIAGKAEEAFSEFMSFRIFGQTFPWNELTGRLQRLPPHPVTTSLRVNSSPSSIIRLSLKQPRTSLEIFRLRQQSPMLPWALSSLWNSRTAMEASTRLLTRLPFARCRSLHLKRWASFLTCTKSNATRMVSLDIFKKRS